MRTKWIILLALTVSVILIGSLAGCADNTPATTPATTPTTSAAPVQATTPATSATPATPVSHNPSPTQAQSVTLNISAAASLTDALQEINDLYMQNNGNVKILENFASSGTLLQQIQQGAPADIFISAASSQMNTLQEGGLIIDSTRQNILNNKVVLVAPVNSTLDIVSFNDLVKDDVKKIAIGDPQFVPAGTYGKQAMELLGIYEQVGAKLILGSDVRQVLGYVESGNVDAGIVYSTDAAITEKVKIVADAPAEINSKIVYPAAVIKSSKNTAEAEAYLNFLLSDDAVTILEKYGFSPIKK